MDRDGILTIIRGRLKDSKEYQDCLIFREKLFSLKVNLFKLVKCTFEKFWDKLKKENVQTDLIKKTCERYVWTGYKLEEVENDWNNTSTNGWWKLVRVFDKNFPRNGNELAVDPSALLILIISCRLFSSRNHLPAKLHSCVDYIRLCRNKLYGHIPDLTITRDMIPSVRNGQNVRTPSFVEIIKMIDDLNESITPGKFNFDSIAINN